MKVVFPVVAFAALSVPAAWAWTVNIPVVSGDMERYGGRQKVFDELKRAEVQWVEFGLNVYEIDPERRRAKFDELRKNCGQARGNGLLPCARVWSFWVPSGAPFTTIRLADGTDTGVFACPLDPAFRKMAADYVADMVRCGARIVILDDDCCYGNRGYCNRSGNVSQYESIACACPLHLRRIGESQGETVTGERLQREAMKGGRNRWRDAWMKVNGESLRAFAVEMRKAVDSVDPTVRLGLCGQATLWDADGTDCATMARLLAGGTRPLLRLISGPYWASRGTHGFRLQDVFEYNRLQVSWCGPDIDVFGEGDPYPRPRNTCPAAYLELYDLLLVANGGFAGDFKYMLDYFAPVGYEKGYVDRHLRNRSLHGAMARIFSGKVAAGVRVRQPMRKLADAVIPVRMEGRANYLASFAPSAGAFLADCGVPTAYEGEGGPSIAFGEDARQLTDDVLSRGVILDLPAARILADRGVDVGLRRVGEEFRAAEEWFPAEDAEICTTPWFSAFRIDVDPRAVVDSTFVFEGPENDLSKRTEGTPAAYFYANAAGGRFMVYAFDGVFGESGKSRGYARARQVRRGVRWLTGRDLPVSTSGNPDVYLLAKRDAKSMAVGVWNLFADEMIGPVFELDEAYDEVSFVNCRGTLERNRVKLSDVGPFSCACFEVRKASAVAGATPLGVKIGGLDGAQVGRKSKMGNARMSVLD